MKNTHHAGQVALIMVLIMTVVSAIAVSLAGRTTVETRIQQMNVENTEALLTAQSGLEASIAQNAALEGSVEVGKDYQVTLSDAGITGITTERIDPGQGFEVSLTGASGLTGIKVYWKAATPSGTPALFISDIRTTQKNDYAYDSTGSNGFTPVVGGGTFDGVNYTYVIPAPINISLASSQKIKITVLVSAAFLGIEPIGGQFPPQFTNFRSVADVSLTDQNVVKYGIEYLESKTDQLPAIFDYVLFSGGSIMQ